MRYAVTLALVLLAWLPVGLHAEPTVPLAVDGDAPPAAPAPEAPERRTSPVDIRAQRMVTDPANGVARFTGEVVARQQDVTLYCHELTVYYGKGAGGGQQIERLEARQAVRLVQGNRVATGEAADYDQQRGVVILRGSAEVHQGKNAVEGDEITLYLNENRSEVKSAGDGRVRAVFFPEPQP